MSDTPDDSLVATLMERAAAAMRAGDPVRAEEALRDAQRRFPTHPEPMNQLGIAAANANRRHEALRCFERAVALSPEHAGYRNNYGVGLERLERYSEALAEYRRALELDPASVDAVCNASVVLQRMGRAAEAVADLERSAKLVPESFRIHHRLGSCLEAAGQAARALNHFRRAAELAPKDATALTDLGRGLMDSAQWDEASSVYARVVNLTPGDATAHNNLGLALANLERVDQAVRHYSRALELDPRDGITHYNYALLLQEHGRPMLAERHYREALRLRPELYQAWNNLGNTLKELGRHAEAIPMYREALRRRAHYPSANSNMLCSMNYDPAADPQTMALEHRRFGERYGARAATFRHDPGRFRADRRLRVGYVSADFRLHSVGYFAQALFTHHDPDVVEVFAYDDVRRPDAMTQWFRDRSAGWRTLRGASDAEAAATMHKDEIDVLVDLAGHTAGNRLLAFTFRPAPVQVSYLGYPNTTGLTEMDYRLCDALTDPGGDDEYTETLVRLPHGFLCYTPPETAPDVTAVPLLGGAPPTFGSFNDLAKLNDDVIEVWARLLGAVPGSRLYLKTKALFDADARDDLARRFAAHSVGPDRLLLSGWTADVSEHLAEYGRVDVALDTFPYCGTTTTCEASWMGVPVITLAGHTHVGRVGMSINERLGLGELVGQTHEDYVEAARALIGDGDRLSALRAGLRATMWASALCDGASFTRSVESAYRDMWRSACRRYGGNAESGT